MRISPRTFGSIKELLARDRLAEAVGAAQIPEAYRDMTPQEAKNLTELVATGRMLLLLKGGKEVLSRSKEREMVVKDLFTIIRRSKMRRRVRWNFAKDICLAAAIVAVHEYVESECKSCFGVGKVRLKADLEGRQAMISCQTCLGVGLKRWKQEERLENLQRYAEIDLKSNRIPEILECVEWSKARLSETIRHAVEETAQQLEIT